MNFKLNALVATLVMAASAPAFAIIGNGADGNGELFFSIWDSANSYTRDLNITLNDFETAVAAGGALNLLYAADATLTSFLSTAISSELQFNVIAVDSLGPRRALETYTSPLPGTTIGNDILRTVISATTTLANEINLKLTSVDSATYAVGTLGYIGRPNFSDNNGGLLNFSNSGDLSTNSAANGLSVLRINGLTTGIAKSTYTPYLDGAAPVKIFLDSNNALHIAAVVPEAETYAMMLAGLGLVGFMVRRRNTRV